MKGAHYPSLHFISNKLKREYIAYKDCLPMRFIELQMAFLLFWLVYATLKYYVGDTNADTCLIDLDVRFNEKGAGFHLPLGRLKHSITYTEMVLCYHTAISHLDHKFMICKIALVWFQLRSQTHCVFNAHAMLWKQWTSSGKEIE